MKKSISPSRWIAITVATYLSMLALVVIGVNFIVDPYGEFRWFTTSFNKYKLEARDTTVYKVMEKLNEGPHALVFGSSRVQMLSSEHLGEPVLNFSTSVYRYPEDILAFLEMLTPKQVKNISKVYYLIDDRMLSEDPKTTLPKTKLTLSLKRFTNITLQKILDAYRTVQANVLNKTPKTYVTEDGALIKENSIGVTYNGYIVSITDKQHKAFQKVINFLNQNKIDTTYFTTPWRQASLKYSVLTEASRLILAQITTQSIPDYYDYFDLYTSPTEDELFSDGNHLNSQGISLFAKDLRHPSPKHKITKEAVTSQIHNASKKVQRTISGGMQASSSQNKLTLPRLESFFLIPTSTSLRLIKEKKYNEVPALSTVIKMGGRYQELIKPVFIHRKSELLLSEHLLRSALLNNHSFFKQLLVYFKNTPALSAKINPFSKTILAASPELLPVYHQLGGSLTSIVNSKTGTNITTDTIANSPEKLPYVLAAKPNLNKADSANRYPLILAAFLNNAQVCKQLLEAGANPNIRDHSGNTPLRMAIAKGYKEVASILTLHGAKP